MLPTNIKWPDELLQALKACIADKLSSGATADILGMTRSAVSGKAHREGLKFVSKPGHAGKRKKRPINPRVRSHSNHTRFLSKSYKHDPGLKEVPMERPEYLGIPLRDLGERQCHFIAGTDRLYCGQATDDDSPYCVWHQGIMYQPHVVRKGPMNLPPMGGV